jgi:hypothetical protein
VHVDPTHVDHASPSVPSHAGSGAAAGPDPLHPRDPATPARSTPAAQEAWCLTPRRLDLSPAADASPSTGPPTHIQPPAPDDAAALPRPVTRLQRGIGSLEHCLHGSCN